MKKQAEQPPAEHFPIDPDRKREFFNHVLLTHLPQARVLFRGGHLWNKDKWRNVAEHCVTAFAAMRTLTRELGLSQEEQERSANSALCHDWKRRMEKEPESFNAQERQEAERLLDASGADPVLLAATGENIIRKTLIEKTATFPERLQAYVDDICRHSEIVPMRERTAEVRARRQDLDSDEAITARLGGKFWDRNLEMEVETEREIFDRLAQRGVHLNSPEEVPDFIKLKLAEEIADFGTKSREREPRYTIQTLSEQRRGDPEKNEDQFAWKENGSAILAGVFDGATALSDVEYFKNLGKTPGRAAAEIAKETLESAPADTNPRNLLFMINRALREKAAEIPVDDETKAELFTTMGFVVHIDKQTRELSFARLGDCMMVVLFADGKAIWYTDEQTEEIERQQIKFALEVSRRESIPMREALAHPEVARAVGADRKLENNPSGEGYGALKGSPDTLIEQYIESGSIRLSPGDRAFILCDGMLMNLFTHEQQRDAERALRKGGLKELLVQTRELQERDPDCATFPRFKQFDDATGIEIAAAE